MSPEHASRRAESDVGWQKPTGYQQYASLRQIDSGRHLRSHPVRVFRQGMAWPNYCDGPQRESHWNAWVFGIGEERLGLTPERVCATPTGGDHASPRLPGGASSQGRPG